ncbi:L-arabinokinase-like [Papaver somniferum]|uniref:L-arabinokinase-like n=1 Tax=Papaver somniferum TaxID=3469 RepID=UPI000E7030E2|nr:L-arabinokinase-like [Papaver somniferum]
MPPASKVVTGTKKRIWHEIIRRLALECVTVMLTARDEKIGSNTVSLLVSDVVPIACRAEHLYDKEHKLAYLLTIPSHIRFWGIDSGIRHSVGGADYGSVRIGAFMGRKIIKSIASGSLPNSSSSANTPEQVNELEEDGNELREAEASLDYLCNLAPHRYEAVYEKKLPESILGETFLETYLDHKRSYAVKAPARHPIYENFRVKAFKALLTAVSSNDQFSALGELVYQCQYSYSACGLGSDGTDGLVKLVQEMQHCKVSKSENGTLFGAKITGGGSGGSVCILGRNCLTSSEQILEIQKMYKAATGFKPFVFEGSSPGAGEFVYLKIRRRFPPTEA